MLILKHTGKCPFRVRTAVHAGLFLQVKTNHELNVDTSRGETIQIHVRWNVHSLAPPPWCAADEPRSHASAGQCHLPAHTLLHSVAGRDGRVGRCAPRRHTQHFQGAALAARCAQTPASWCAACAARCARQLVCSMRSTLRPTPTGVQHAHYAALCVTCVTCAKCAIA